MFKINIQWKIFTAVLKKNCNEWNKVGQTSISTALKPSTDSVFMRCYNLNLQDHVLVTEWVSM